MSDGSYSDESGTPVGSRRVRLNLAILLSAAFALRLWLAWLGGQMFWDDEGRYAIAEVAADELVHARWKAAAVALFGQPIHTLFPFCCLPPALLEHVIGLNLPLTAAYFGLFSVLAIYLVWRVARRAGADETEAWWAAYMAACANSLFYYSRHFFPYDISLCAMLGSLCFALGPPSARNSWIAGILAALGFLIYNGYWLLGGCVLALHVILGAGGWRRFAARGLFALLGLLTALLPVVSLSRALGFHLVAQDANIASIAQGDFPYGREVVTGYLWYAEGGLLIVWLVAFGYAAWVARGAERAGRLAWYAGGVALGWVGLIVLSDVFPVFTVQGRRVRQLVPFLCLGAALGIARFIRARRARGRVWAAAIALLAAGCAAWNFSIPLRQVFPGQFQRLAAAAAARQPGYHAYRLAFVGSLLGRSLDDGLPLAPAILRRPHPLQFRPYQYEGYGAPQRNAINAHDVAMRLVAWPGGFDRQASRWDGYPGPVRFVLRLPSSVAGHSEPLVVTGRTGRGDIFYIHYIDSGHVSFGLDHWGVRATISSPVAIDYGQPHEIIFFAGFLLPPEKKGTAGANPPGSDRRDQLWVRLDGHLVFSMAESFYPVGRSDISFGVNFIGGSTAEAQFSGAIMAFGPAARATGRE